MTPTTPINNNDAFTYNAPCTPLYQLIIGIAIKLPQAAFDFAIDPF
jgi:hypothetical protein